MTPGQWVFWITLAVLGVVGCGLCAGLETGVYSLNRIRLHLLAQRGHRGATILAKLLRQPSTLIASLLIGTNIATNLATSATGIILESFHLPHWQVIVLDLAIVTPLLFVFAEVLPKDLFAAYADSLVYPFAPLLDRMKQLWRWTGLLPAVTLSTDLAMKMLKVRGTIEPFHPRRQVGKLVQEGVEYGLLTHEQSAMVHRVLNLNQRRVADEMVPWAKVVTLRTGDPVATLLAVAERSSVSRFPVLDERGKVEGVVSLYEALKQGRKACPPVRDLVKPVLTLDPDMPSRLALAKLQTSRTPVALVVARDRPVGLVTVKDLVEPITGELSNW